ncbi:MAG: hypothetical protein WCI47_00860 [bacterium]
MSIAEHLSDLTDEPEAQSNTYSQLEPATTSENESTDVQYSVLTLENYMERVVHEQGLKPSRFETDQDMRADYIQRTESLMLDMIRKDIDTVVYLDKSARPISWFVKELWPVFIKDSERSMPETKYANVDANSIMHRSADQSRPTDEEIGQFTFTDDQIQGLRELFADPQNPGQSYFDGKKVMILDEIFVTGSSLKLAQRLFEMAFPGAEFTAKAWMIADFHEDRRMSRRTLREIPVWYHDADEYGRGVGDPTDESNFQSSRFETPDELGNQLRKETHQLAIDIMSGKQPIIPDLDRMDSGVYDGMTIRTATKPKTQSLFD